MEINPELMKLYKKYLEQVGHTNPEIAGNLVLAHVQVMVMQALVPKTILVPENDHE